MLVAARPQRRGQDQPHPRSCRPAPRRNRGRSRSTAFRWPRSGERTSRAASPCCSRTRRPDFWGSVARLRHARPLPAIGQRLEPRRREPRRRQGAGSPSSSSPDRAAQAYRTLSGGERQRARIAQVLLQDSGVMLLDEPLQHLDLRHQAIVMGTLAARAAEGKRCSPRCTSPGTPRGTAASRFYCMMRAARAWGAQAIC